MTKQKCYELIDKFPREYLINVHITLSAMLNMAVAACNADCIMQSGDLIDEEKSKFK